MVPEYEGKIAFVNAISDSQSGEQLARMLTFNYIPTSFFVDGAGKVVGSYTGPLTEVQMRQRLDQLAGGQQ